MPSYFSADILIWTSRRTMGVFSCIQILQLSLFCKNKYEYCSVQPSSIHLGFPCALKSECLLWNKPVCMWWIQTAWAAADKNVKLKFSIRKKCLDTLWIRHREHRKTAIWCVFRKGKQIPDWSLIYYKILMYFFRKMKKLFSKICRQSIINTDYCFIFD